MDIMGIDFGSIIKSGFDYVMYNFVHKALYTLEILVCQFIDWLQQLFNIFAGVTTVSYGDDDPYLIEVFFNNSAIAGVFRGMAAIGIVFTFMFSIIAVIRKLFDVDDKMKSTYGQILRNMFRSFLIIICLHFSMTVVITFTNTLMTAVTKVFNDGEDNTLKSHIDFTDEQFAAMARIFNTIGNYSLNPSYKNRYNLNTCYNEIRGDLRYLGDTGVFEFYYETKDSKGKVVNTWQSVLQDIASAANYNTEVPVDVYNEAIANSLSNCMTIMKTDSSFHALESYDRTYKFKNEDIDLGRLVFLIGTMGMGKTAGARNDVYNKEPKFTDNCRLPYYYGIKDVYDLNQVNQDFDISYEKTNYIVVYFSCTVLILNMGIIIVSCIVRIFNLLFLYIIAPPIIGVMPLDDGQKFKQWVTAFIIQAFSVFATVISMRLFLIFVPVIMSPNLQLSNNIYLDMLGKLIAIWAGVIAVQRANGLLTGILADSAGQQSLFAGDVGNDVRGKMTGIAQGALGLGGSVAKTGLKGAWKLGKGTVKTGWKAAVGGEDDGQRGVVGTLRNKGIIGGMYEGTKAAIKWGYNKATSSSSDEKTPKDVNEGASQKFLDQNKEQNGSAGSFLSNAAGGAMNAVGSAISGAGNIAGSAAEAVGAEGVGSAIKNTTGAVGGGISGAGNALMSPPPKRDGSSGGGSNNSGGNRPGSNGGQGGQGGNSRHGGQSGPRGSGGQGGSGSSSGSSENSSQNNSTPSSFMREAVGGAVGVVGDAVQLAGNVAGGVAGAVGGEGLGNAISNTTDAVGGGINKGADAIKGTKNESNNSQGGKGNRSRSNNNSSGGQGHNSSNTNNGGSLPNKSNLSSVGEGGTGASTNSKGSAGAADDSEGGFGSTMAAIGKGVATVAGVGMEIAGGAASIATEVAGDAVEFAGDIAGEGINNITGTELGNAVKGATKAGSTVTKAVGGAAGGLTSKAGSGLRSLGKKSEGKEGGSGKSGSSNRPSNKPSSNPTGGASPSNANTSGNARPSIPKPLTNLASSGGQEGGKPSSGSQQPDNNNNQPNNQASGGGIVQDIVAAGMDIAGAAVQTTGAVAGGAVGAVAGEEAGKGITDVTDSIGNNLHKGADALKGNSESNKDESSLPKNQSGMADSPESKSESSSTQPSDAPSSASNSASMPTSSSGSDDDKSDNKNEKGSGFWSKVGDYSDATVKGVSHGAVSAVESVGSTIEEFGDWLFDVHDDNKNPTPINQHGNLQPLTPDKKDEDEEDDDDDDFEYAIPPSSAPMSSEPSSDNSGAQSSTSSQPSTNTQSSPANKPLSTPPPLTNKPPVGPKSNNGGQSVLNNLANNVSNEPPKNQNPNRK